LRRQGALPPEMTAVLKRLELLAPASSLKRPECRGAAPPPPPACELGKRCVLLGVDKERAKGSGGAEGDAERGLSGASGGFSECGARGQQSGSDRGATGDHRECVNYRHDTPPARNPKDLFICTFIFIITLV